jgi:hypothetical protein
LAGGTEDAKRLLDNLTDSAHPFRMPSSKLLESWLLKTAAFSRVSSQKTFRIHERHRVFLI